ncbi:MULTISPECIES: tyrosine-type recombinase/integrase [Bacillus]|uniref:tyrosine-type recombinase/integrase n=1 Tax=Bacillus TaxID=1386 RepID=UPI0002D96B07|nr:tyrosine-type recombinase/integrase [Bacillus pseudomycoides]MED1596216.1 tyrosine-type recombinase/integrase [Bacillus pseudomycoides]MED4710013.1 tyrosine-type recombinase/integrase [Bacillus pseudomycoides]OOR54486.1 integrase [Bacillus pseudomycoides]PDY11801.1 integrase [Bacillus pseudomycoides]PEI42462.1 integrase [Bacillus pseudomycoides]
MTTITDLPTSPFYNELIGKVYEHFLHLQDNRGVFLLDKLDESPVKYFLNQCLDTPWQNQLLLYMLISGDRNLDTNSIANQLRTLCPRFKDIFHTYELQTFADFDTEKHMYQYLKGLIYPEHSNDQRARFLSRYKSISYSTNKWLIAKLNQEQREYFQQFLLPKPLFDSRDFTFTKQAREQAQNTRKSETDAILPYLPQIRAEANFRWNQMKRLREAFLTACKQAEKREVTLPIEFHYDEPERIGERFYFRLWDKPSFVLYQKEKFTEFIVTSAEQRTRTYSEANNHYFVEFVKAERLEDDDVAEGLWFAEILQEGVLGKWFQNVMDEGLEQKRELLFSWGYGEEGSISNPSPFESHHKGVLSQTTFVTQQRDKAEGILFDMEPFYAASTFGLLAVDILTTTGARINELLQINRAKDCLQAMRVNGDLKYSFYAVPKGRDTVESYIISKQTFELMKRVNKMLKKHYNGAMPSVKYQGDRKHLFPETKPYFFQYNKKGLKDRTIHSCLRFLLHGLHFETQEGKHVIIKTHLLRHAFATEAVQRQEIPVDIVAKILHQRDLNVTRYYSEPTPSQVAEKVGELHSVILNYVDLDEAILRSPEELQREWEEHKAKVGVYNNVLGGTCVTDKVCPVKMACLGCVAKIPQPEKKHELLEVVDLSKDMEKRYASLDLTIEVNKAKQMRKLARNELKEIELIEKYREEQTYEPDVSFKR